MNRKGNWAGTRRIPRPMARRYWPGTRCLVSSTTSAPNTADAPLGSGHPATRRSSNSTRVWWTKNSSISQRCCLPAVISVRFAFVLFSSLYDDYSCFLLCLSYPSNAFRNIIPQSSHQQSGRTVPQLLWRPTSWLWQLVGDVGPTLRYPLEVRDNISSQNLPHSINELNLNQFY